MYHVLLFPPPAMVMVVLLLLRLDTGWGPLGARGGKGTSGKSGTNRDIHNNIYRFCLLPYFSLSGVIMKIGGKGKLHTARWMSENNIRYLSSSSSSLL
jgi:hypothetical protein